MANRQTISYLTQRFAGAGLKPVTRFGQNFLIDLNLVDLIARSADVGGKDVALEIGTGMGTLTTRLADRAGHVVTVEIDRYLAELAQQEIGERDNVTLLVRDALKNKNRIHPEVRQATEAALQRIRGGRLKLVANLPYNVATPILSNLLDHSPRPALMVATIQKELAERICSPPSTKDYSALSVWIQAQCKTKIVRVLPPSVFWPRPKVTSAILKITPLDSLRERIADPEFFHRTIRAIFLHRRKFLRSTTISAMKNQLDKSDVDQVLSELGFAEGDRAEEQPVERLIELVNALHLRCVEQAEKT